MRLAALRGCRRRLCRRWVLSVSACLLHGYQVRVDAARRIARLQETFVSQVGGWRVYLCACWCSNPHVGLLLLGAVQHVSRGGRMAIQPPQHVCLRTCRSTRPLPTALVPLTFQPVQAAAQQRRGRAGRVRPGVCYRLFSRRTWARMPRDTPPEIARAPLQVGGRLRIYTAGRGSSCL